MAGWEFLRLFIRLGFLEVVTKYRRTTLGSTWIAAGFAVFVLAWDLYGAQYLGCRSRVTFLISVAD